MIWSLTSQAWIIFICVYILMLENNLRNLMTKMFKYIIYNVECKGACYMC